ncbi:MAG: glycerophosphodiester phosphodiesterase [Candidatus Binatia bacterium]
MSRRWLRIAHRGASGSAPEHTRAAFVRALALGVDMIELDVQLTRDQQLVVMHDVDLGRTTTGRGPVHEHDLNALTALDAGSWFGSDFTGERVLSLEDVIALIGGRARLNVEMKAAFSSWPALASRLVETLRACDLLDSTIVSCFAPPALLAVREQASQVRLGLLWDRPNLADAWEWARKLRAASIHPHWRLVSADLVRKAAAQGLKVLAWTVNDVTTMRRLVRQGVQGIMSDFPERFAEIAV